MVYTPSTCASAERCPKTSSPREDCKNPFTSPLGCHDLPIDSGRRQGILRDERICTRCSLGMVGDEFHFLFTCPLLEHIRSQFSHIFQAASPISYSLHVAARR
eukprot:jgi/Botrbrau1/14960/Bobra.0018s0063.1